MTSAIVNIISGFPKWDICICCSLMIKNQVNNDLKLVLGVLNALQKSYNENAYLQQTLDFPNFSFPHYLF